MILNISKQCAFHFLFQLLIFSILFLTNAWADEFLGSSVKEVKIKEVKFPFNSSIVEFEEGYALVFRQDIKNNSSNFSLKYVTRLGVVKLNQNFEQISDCVFLNTQSFFSEDPRMIKFKDKWFLIYSDVIGSNIRKRGIFFAELNDSLSRVEKIYRPFIQKNEIEKNWTPFIAEDGYLSISYQIYPHIVYKFDMDQNGSLYMLNEKTSVEATPNKMLSRWEKKYGQLRGGTPAIRIDGKLISFFHSSKREQHVTKYFFGAIAFDDTPPHRVKAVSKDPLDYDGIYTSKRSFFSSSSKLVVFPCGIVDLGDSVVVSCGENDSCTKLVKFSKDELLDSMLLLE